MTDVFSSGTMILHRSIAKASLPDADWAVTLAHG